jgi:peptidoglycan/xylan/chitin deacetylase (PgdA/CDA1 family)
MNALPKYQQILYKLFSVLRFTDLARFWNRNNVMILCYHGITRRNGVDPDDRSSVTVDRARFREHMNYLRRNYNVIALSDYLAARNDCTSLPRHSVVLTFDDGLRNFLTTAAPVLKELDLPATMYLITDRVDARGDSSLGEYWTPADDRSSLSWAEVTAMQRAGNIEFGSHTCTHPELPRLSAGEIDSELARSRSTMRTRTCEISSLSLAYPYGDYSSLIAEKARAAGYSCALTTDPGANTMDTHLFQLRRAVVRRFDTVEIFAARVSGLIGWMRMARDAFQKLRVPLARFRDSALLP